MIAKSKNTKFRKFKNRKRIKLGIKKELIEKFGNCYTAKDEY
jgi:hypothetical protein